MGHKLHKSCTSLSIHQDASIDNRVIIINSKLIACRYGASVIIRGLRLFTYGAGILRRCWSVLSRP